MNKWYETKGPQSETVLSTRVRLSRNLEDYPFPSRLDSEGKKKVNELVKTAVFEGGNQSLEYFEMKDLTRLQAISLAERHVISPDFTDRKEGAALLISQDESVSIMLCEEDHVKIQAVQSGLALDEVFARCDEIDSLLDSKLNYAFDEKIGYLTSRPTDLGTAMKASVLVHLPALTALGQIPRLASTVSKLGINITGAYGNRIQPAGDIYRVSNCITLGITESTAIANLKSIVLQLVAQEKAAQEKEIKTPSEEDKIYRSLGVLQNARLLSTNEFMELISQVRLGAVNGLVDIPVEDINSLIIEMQPATVSVNNSGLDSITARDARRAELVRDRLKV